jgi:hypothetical protein
MSLKLDEKGFPKATLSHTCYVHNLLYQPTLCSVITLRKLCKILGKLLEFMGPEEDATLSLPYFRVFLWQPFRILVTVSEQHTRYYVEAYILRQPEAIPINLIIL